MNTLLVFAIFFVGACVADVSHIVDQRPPIAILRSAQDLTPDGAYQYGYETENGISAQAQGSPNGDAQGSYRYTDPTGQVVEITWTASAEKGFVATGAAVPATPEYVYRSLEFNAAHPYKEPVEA